MNCSTFSSNNNAAGAFHSEEECSGSGSELLLHTGILGLNMGDEVDNTVSLLSLASEEDDDVEFDTSDVSDDREVLMAGRSYSSVQEFASAIPNHLLLGSLLEHLCFVYENNPARSRVLFKVIGQRLAAMNLLSPLAISDEFSTVRLQHNRAFTELLHAASSSLCPQAQTRLATTSHNSTVTPIEGLFQAQTSRYLSEFEEICRLGKGSYGNVFKVLNKLDGQFYAVKKILIKKVSKEDCMKVLREVKVLSSLQHVNVVGYHTAWMEHVQPAAYPQSSLPALESPGQHNSSDQSHNNSSGSSIVFQSLTQELSITSSDKHSEVNCAVRASVSTPEKGQVVCTKPKHHIQENYVPCVFLGQQLVNNSKCPIMGADNSIVFEEESSRSNTEQSNGSCDREWQQRVEKCATKPIKEVQFHLMLYIQMHLCERSLKDWISERNAKPKDQHALQCPFACVDSEQTLSILKKILEGVQYIHSRGIIHRDLKPRNIFLHGHDCHVRIGDFGLACRDLILEGHKGQASGSPCGDSSHTTGVGTFVYASPEQLKGSHYDSKSDMYSVGMLAFELFQPFGTEMERVRSLGDLREGKIPDSFCCRWPKLVKHILNLTNIDPDVRPSATELLQSELFCSKDTVIHGLQKQVEEQEKEIMHLRRRISELESSNPVSLSDENET